MLRLKGLTKHSSDEAEERSTKRNLDQLEPKSIHRERTYLKMWTKKNNLETVQQLTDWKAHEKQLVQLTDSLKDYSPANRTLLFIAGIPTSLNMTQAQFLNTSESEVVVLLGNTTTN